MKMLALSAAVLLGGCTAASQPQATASAAGERDCFDTSFVQGFAPAGTSTIRLDLGNGRKYDVAIEGAQCSQVDWTQRLVLESTPSSWICVGQAIGQGNIYFHDPATWRRLSCYIKDVRRVSEPPKQG